MNVLPLCNARFVQSRKYGRAIRDFLESCRYASLVTNIFHKAWLSHGKGL